MLCSMLPRDAARPNCQSGRTDEQMLQSDDDSASNEIVHMIERQRQHMDGEKGAANREIKVTPSRSNLHG